MSKWGNPSQNPVVVCNELVHISAQILVDKRCCKVHLKWEANCPQVRTLSYGCINLPQTEKMWFVKPIFCDLLFENEIAFEDHLKTHTPSHFKWRKVKNAINFDLPSPFFSFHISFPCMLYSIYCNSDIDSTSAYL